MYEVIRVDVFAEVLKHNAELKKYLKDRTGKSKIFAQIQQKQLVKNEAFIEAALALL